MKSLKPFFIVSFILVFLFCSANLFAQDDTQPSTTTQKKNSPVKGTFETGTLINNQTVTGLKPKTLEFMIQHRFGTITKVDEDKTKIDAGNFFGLFAPSNIRLGLDYGITDRLGVGIGVTKNKRLYDLNLKYVALKQTQPGGMPVSLAYYGNVSRSAQDKTTFNNQENEYVGANRLSYFHEIMIARKISPKFSVQLAGSYSYVNIVDSLQEHSTIGVSFAGKYKFSAQSSVHLEFDYPVTTHQVNPQKPNMGIGYEISTGTHQFQVFICTADAINNAQIMMFNQNDFAEKQILIGFNITRNWSF